MGVAPDEKPDDLENEVEQDEDEDEDDGPRDPTRKAPRRPPRAKYITAAGAGRLRDELDHLWKVERAKVTQAVHDAALLGDRSENADYIYGKRRLREIDRRVHFLTKRLEELIVVGAPPADVNRVFFGAWITVTDDDDVESKFRIVGPDEFDVETGLISLDSPVAKALLGKRLGDEAIVKRPKGETTYTIIAITYEPAAASP